MWPVAMSGTCSLSLSLSLKQQASGSPSSSGLSGIASSSPAFPVLAVSCSSHNSLSFSSLSCVQAQESYVSWSRVFQCKALKTDGPPPRFQPRATANTEKVEAEKTEKSIPGVPESPDAKLARRVADWKKAEKMMEAGTIHRGRVDACNSGGLLVRIGSLQGFLPFSQLNGSRLPKDGSKAFAEVGKEIVGELISVKLIEVNEEERRLIFSEKQAVLVESIQQINEGDVFEGKVNSVTDYGAFVDVKFPDGSYPISGLVHVTELSWDPVPFPKEYIQEGEQVRVKVTQVDRERMKLALSIKQLQADPLLETLDTLMPVEPQEDPRLADTLNSDAELIGTPLPGLEQICSEMLQEEGISEIILGRQALERRVVSQDLELWLSNATIDDGKFTLLARAGRLVQEVHLKTSLDREGIKAAVQRVTGRVP